MAALFGKPSTPTVTPPAPMPNENDPAVIEAKRRAALDALTRSGRASTILSAASNSGSGREYSGSKLGAG